MKLELACSNPKPEKIEADPARIQRIEDSFKETIEKYSLIEKGDRVMAAVSGGKDSTVMLYLLKKFGYDVEAVTVDAHIGCYSEENVKNIRQFCDQLGVKLFVASFNKNYGNSVCYITSVLQEGNKNLGTCTVCGVLRRRLLNKSAREVGATKVALGHNADDEVQAFLMNIFRNRQSLNARLGPMPGVIKYKGFVPRIKPLYFATEDDITYYSKAKGFPVAYGECPCSTKSYRYFIKQFVKEAEKEYPQLKENTLKYLISKLPKLRAQYKGTTTPKECVACGEPSATQFCRSCALLEEFKQRSETTNQRPEATGQAQ
jgi:uncharacterized protein (TIGR00269 family)